MVHEKFSFKTLEELQSKVQSLNLDIKFSKNVSILQKEDKIGNLNIPNRLAIHPMEGCDGTTEGVPSDLTIRRYMRFAESGVGIVWWEATAIAPEARANGRQLLLNEGIKESWITLVKDFKQKVLDEGLEIPLNILQITHSGRYSTPGKPYPLRMYEYEPLDKAYGRTKDDGRILRDEELKELPQLYDDTVSLAKEVGFDGVDIKSCHRYLISESLSGYTRENSEFGGASFENRSKLLYSIMDRIIPKYKSPNFLIGLRINCYDGLPYPFGFGAVNSDAKEPPKYDTTEPIKLLNELHNKGVKIANITIGNPYYNPYISRPFDLAPPGMSMPEEHPLEGINRFLSITRQLRKNINPELKLIGTGYTWLRQFAGFVGAAEIENNGVDYVGFGRMAFANPRFGRQLLENGIIDEKASCIACSKCTEMMRMKTVTGCLIRDSKTYQKYYLEAKNALKK